jgi:hypothetical protein
MTDVSPGPVNFLTSYIGKFDANGKIVQLNDGDSEDNSKVDIIYRLYPRDKFNNIINTITNFSLYSFQLIDSKSNAYNLQINNKDDGNQSFIEFVKDDSHNGDDTYDSLTSGIYSANFSNNTKNIKKVINLIGKATDKDASNQHLEPQNSVINESMLSFVAGQSGYLIVETRTTDGLRKNNWLAKLEVKSAIGDTALTSVVRNAGKPGVYYITVSSTNANVLTSGTTPHLLKIFVNGVEVIKLQPEILVSPNTMDKAEILQDYIKSPNILLEGSADIPYVFKIKSVDKYGNPSLTDFNMLKLSIIDPNNNLATYDIGKDVTTGMAIYTLSNKLAGSYAISANNNLPSYTLTI